MCLAGRIVTYSSFVKTTPYNISYSVYPITLEPGT